MEVIIKEDRARDILRRIAEFPENLNHAYLLWGPSGLGKKEAARDFAVRLLGMAGSNHTHHPDLMVLERQGNTIRIAEVRRLQEWLAYKPYSGRYRVIIIPEAHLLTIEAANALLKTLEEPPEYSVMVLTADQETLPLTVVSRCQAIRFSPLSAEQVVKLLEDQGIDRERARMLAIISEGRPGRALAMDSLEPELLIKRAAQLLEAILADNRMALYEAVESMQKDKTLIDQLLIVIEILLRDALLYEKGLCHQSLLLTDHLADQLKPLGFFTLKNMIRLVGRARKDLTGNANPLLLQVNLLLKLAVIVKEES